MPEDCSGKRRIRSVHILESKKRCNTKEEREELVTKPDSSYERGDEPRRESSKYPSSDDISWVVYPSENST